MVYDLKRRLLLVSAKYKCPICRRDYSGHDENLLIQIPKGNFIPFINFHINSITKSAFYFIVNSIKIGGFFELKC